MKQVNPDTPVRFLHGVGPQRARLFASLGISTVEDLLQYLPRRYEDRSRFTPVAGLREGEVQTVKARVVAGGGRRSVRRRGFNIFEAVVEDDTGRITCVWFNQPYLAQYLKAGTSVILYGKVEQYAGRLQMSVPDFEIDDPDAQDQGLSIGRIVPVYSLPKGLTQRLVRRLVFHALEEAVPRLRDVLPYDLRQRQGFPNVAQSVRALHFPDSLESQERAFERFCFDEFFFLQLLLAMRKRSLQRRGGIAHPASRGLIEEFIGGLPFTLTASQKEVCDEVMRDMSDPRSMHRLLQGEVGSGKTIVALIATLRALEGGYQVAFLVPTEILAWQHHRTVQRLFERLNVPLWPRGLAMLTAQYSAKEKDAAIEKIRSGEINLVIGTHALLEEEIRFHNLGLVVIDEQHKFGVGQRALLPQKGVYPDVLIMTATPIPRTLAMTIYGDMDMSVLRGLPAGRKPVTTKWITPEDRPWLYEFLAGQLKEGRQAYIVYPVIEESHVLDLAGARQMYDALRKGPFKGFTVSLIHGQLKRAEQEKIMEGFRTGKTQLLVATTVLEVGIDVANATVMAVEHAERFGLSQLHQLRGRIGRGSFDSSCILVSAAPTRDAERRLKALVTHRDGFAIAEQDLKIRGPGEFFGTRQHGLTELRFGNPLTQMRLLKRARDEARRLLEADPQLALRPHGLLKERLLRRFPEYEKLLTAA